MSKKKRLAVGILLLLVVLLASLSVAMIWFMNEYVVVDFKIYPKNAAMLDLRQEEISVSQYKRLQRQLPDSQILWNIPFQDTSYDCDTQVLTVSSLSKEDVTRLQYFTKLETLDARQCREYSQLHSAMQTYPNLQVLYEVELAGVVYPQDTQQIRLDTVTEQDIVLLPNLLQLKTVALTGAADQAAVTALKNYCRDRGLAFCVILGDQAYSQDVEQLQVTQMSQEQLALLAYLPNLKEIHLKEPLISAEDLMTLRSRPGLQVTWEKTICGLTFDHTAQDIDLSEGQITSIEEVEQGMEYLPDAKSLFLGFCGLDNEEIAAYRERSREKYKVVWVVDLSGKMKVRTDIDNFMPSRDGWGYVRDGEVDNIRYCEDLICIDLGHMGIKNVDFLETLTNLEYLILAHTEVQYIDAIVNCKKLKYLELDWSCIRDVSPLVECTALEDLNLGMVWPDITPILQMTWLKNLYLIKGNCKANFAEALPNTRVITNGEYTVSSGWRNLPNYYAMRDILGMYYM